MKVYLCGPIHGCTDEEARGWRDEAKRGLGGVTFVDPMDRDFRGNEEDNVHLIVNGDKAEIASCDVLLVNAERPSWGTAMEIHEAWQSSKLVVAFCSGRVSPWLRYHCTVVFPTLTDALVYLGERE